MNLSPQQPEDPEINLTSLIDVVFLLLIFFMITTTFDQAAMLQIELPKAAEANTTPVPDRLEIVVNSEGQFFLDSNELVNTEIETLKTALQEKAGQRRDMPVIIRADGRAPHQSVVTAMDALGQLGFVNLQIATTQTE